SRPAEVEDRPRRRSRDNCEVAEHVGEGRAVAGERVGGSIASGLQGARQIARAEDDEVLVGPRERAGVPIDTRWQVDRAARRRKKGDRLCQRRLIVGRVVASDAILSDVDDAADGAHRRNLTLSVNGGERRGAGEDGDSPKGLAPLSSHWLYS